PLSISTRHSAPLILRLCPSTIPLLVALIPRAEPAFAVCRIDDPRYTYRLGALESAESRPRLRRRGIGSATSGQGRRCRGGGPREDQQRPDPHNPHPPAAAAASPCRAPA